VNSGPLEQQTQEEKQQDMLGQIIKQTQIEKELNIVTGVDKIQEYIRNWLQHINRMPRNR
jgi:hypothetical protein